jgi:predicted TIM-barrel fold metal-dependent hydrolase
MKPARRKFFPIPFLIAALAACAGPVSRMPREVVAKIPLVDFHAHYPGRPPRTAQEFIKTMDSVGIEQTVLFLGGTGSREASELQKYSDRFVLFFAGPAANDAVRAKIKTGDPKAVEEMLADYERALQSGLYSGLGEIYAYHSERPTKLAPDSPAIRGLLELVTRYGIPISIHCTADGKPEMERALKSHPKATVIWAHTGTFLSPAAMMDLLQAHPNLYFELAIKNKRLRIDRYPILSGMTLREDWRQLFESYPERFFLGFDFPGTGPNHGTPLETAADSAEFFRTILMQLNPSTARKIAYQNARAILAKRRASSSAP